MVQISRDWCAATAFAAGLCLSVSAVSPANAVGLLTPSDQSQSLDLLDHRVSVVVEDGYVMTTVNQTFSNPHTSDMEATYSFPVPHKAAVSEFTYWIDGKPVSAEVVDKEKARQIYEGEKQAGRNTALAEQDDYKTFDISVWPVRGNDDVDIRFSYIQPAKLDTGIGRYLYPLEEGGVDEEKLAFWTAKQTVTGTFSFDLHLRTDYPVEAVRLPKHPGAQITQEQDGSWRIHMSNTDLADGLAKDADLDLQPSQPIDETGINEGEATASRIPVTLDQDIVVYWRQAQNQPARVDLVPYKTDPSGRGTFMLTLTPGMDLKPITEGRDWIFVLDQSGSMGGKIATLSEGVAKALGKLRPEDRFRIIFFNNDTTELTNGFTPASPDQITHALNSIHSVQAGGGTNLYAGLKRGLDALDSDRTGAIVLVTDGVANVGTTETKKFLELAQQKDVRLFTAIMGNSANEPLLQPMTDASGGFALRVSNADDIVGTLLQATSKVTHEALHGLKLDLTQKDGSLRINDIRRRNNPSLYRGEQLVLFGHYWGNGEASFKLTGEISGSPVSYETSFTFPETAKRNPEIERLWGYAQIEKDMQTLALLGPDADLKTSIVDTSKEYGILSPYTSMLIVEEARFEELAIDQTNKERLATEQVAQQERKSKPVQSTRVDTKKPMFKGNQPSHSGGGGGGSGSLGILGLLLALSALTIGLKMRRRNA
ncbi:VIT and VWA domain-containing protein [Roseibium porphyridii]|uniref:VIT and VWA domain-containing protein n=1 Tax=Roseibium porphyridii TaxID=2866279 RepID=A0ABY8F118_9HYPH|nr:VIT and VWA domain-containing protein [Roseibium sp. KMA01]WFE89143.1 VIT and VWA domain-containing protein [Roseibium sp. KMA01]